MSEDNKAEIKSGADELEVLNSKIENAKTDEERQAAFDEAIAAEEKLDMLENELGLSGEDAKKVLVCIYEGRFDIADEIAELMGNEEGQPTREGMASRFKSFMASLDMAKDIKKAAAFAAAFFILAGGAALAEAKDMSNGSANPVKIFHGQDNLRTQAGPQKAMHADGKQILINANLLTKYDTTFLDPIFGNSNIHDWISKANEHKSELSPDSLSVYENLMSVGGYPQKEMKTKDYFKNVLAKWPIPKPVLEKLVSELLGHGV